MIWLRIYDFSSFPNIVRISYKWSSERHLDCLRQDLNISVVTPCVSALSCHNLWHIGSPPHQTSAILSSTPESGVHPQPCSLSVPLQLLRGLQRLHENNRKMAQISPQILRGRQRLPAKNGTDRLDGWGWGRYQNQDVLLWWQPVVVGGSWG